MIEAYPFNWHRKLDFMPPMGLQVISGAKDLELYYCLTRVSIKESATQQMRRETPTEYGTLRVNPAFRNNVEYSMGVPNPRNGIVPVPQKEILDDIQKNLGGAVRIVGNLPDVVIKSRGVVEDIPKTVENLGAFQGSQYVFTHQNAYGNFIHRVRKSLGIRSIENPYYFIRSTLLRYGIIRSPRDPVLRKLRSTLKTEYVVTDASGWSDLGDANILALEQARMRWWTDIGRPTAFQIPINHTGVQGQIYRLLRRNCLVVV